MEQQSALNIPELYKVPHMLKLGKLLALKKLPTCVYAQKLLGGTKFLQRFNFVLLKLILRLQKTGFTSVFICHVNLKYNSLETFYCTTLLMSHLTTRIVIEQLINK